MQQVFTSSMDFGRMLDNMDFTGGAFEPHAIQPQFLLDLAAEVVQLETKPRIYDGKVSERYDRARMIGRERFSPLILVLANQLSWGVRLAMGRRTHLRAWEPNDVEVHHYRDESVGITPHRDFSDNQYIIVSVTIEGFAPFEFHGEERMACPTIWETGPGSVVMLSAENYGGRTPRRPYHAIGAPYGSLRTSAIFWMSRRVETIPS